MASSWVYIFGEKKGRDIKIGRASIKAPAERRLRQVNGEQTTDESYVCLAAVIASKKEEDHLKRRFAHLRRDDKGHRTEYFRPEDELVEYAAWLRSQYFVSPDGGDSAKGWTAVESSVWLPDGEARRMPAPTADPDKLVQDWETLPGPLAGTVWSWFPNPRASVQDYFTPPPLINAVREGMGGIDLDAASHWLANQHLRIPRYFHIGMNAFDHDWTGKIWLNPPYGDNDPWWNRIIGELDADHIEQICILSPVWAFTTAIARPLMDRCAAMLLLSPTPKFWGNAEKRTGKNHPHAIVYIGNRPSEVLSALGRFGISMRFDQLDQADEMDAHGALRESPYEEYEAEFIHRDRGNGSADPPT